PRDPRALPRQPGPGLAGAPPGVRAPVRRSSLLARCIRQAAARASARPGADVRDRRSARPGGRPIATAVVSAVQLWRAGRSHIGRPRSAAPARRPARRAAHPRPRRGDRVSRGCLGCAKLWADPEPERDSLVRQRRKQRVAKVKMPQLGESVAEGTIGRWLKKPGDHVDKYEPIVEVITDKVNAEVPSPFAGTLTKILVEEGATVPNNAEIAEIDEAGGGAATPE